MACLVFFQIIILQLQTTFGPTFFIPDTIIPKPFQYFKKFKKSEVKSTLLAVKYIYIYIFNIGNVFNLPKSNKPIRNEKDEEIRTDSMRA